MTDKFQNKYRIPSARLQNWDYRWAGACFINICTKNREHYFGKIENGKMQLSEIGRIVEREWIKTFDMRPDMNLQMGEFVVMPNHFHAIIIIEENECNKRDGGDTSTLPQPHDVSTPPPHETDKPKNRFGSQSKNLASIIRGFKIGVTTNARIINPEFAWQRLFHDHIIRNEQSFKQKQTYIKENPAKWVNDKFYNKK